MLKKLINILEKSVIKNGRVYDKADKTFKTVDKIIYTDKNPIFKFIDGTQKEYFKGGEVTDIMFFVCFDINNDPVYENDVVELNSIMISSDINLPKVEDIIKINDIHYIVAKTEFSDLLDYNCKLYSNIFDAPEFVV